MVTRVSRPMAYAGRFGRQQADQAVKRDLVRALVELITNSDDSYRRMERQGLSVSGQILIEIQRRRIGSIVRVTDFAEGMDDETLDRAVGTYADETSGFLAGEPVRGYFGRGIKDAILGLGEGTVTGVVDGQQHRAWLGIRDNEPYYDAQNPIPLSHSPRSNSTVVEITVTRDDVRIPQIDNLRTQLELHFGLRDITTSNSRTVILKNLGGRSRQEFDIKYQFPQSQQLLSEAYVLEDFGASCEFNIYRSDVPLGTPREQGYTAQAGLLIKGENATFDNTLLRFDGNSNAHRIYGTVTCRHLDDLLRENEPILLATRDGLDRSHPFVRRLFALCEEILEPLVEREAQRARREQSRAQSDELRNKLNDAVGRFNQIARNELADMDILDPTGDPEILIPETGFGFVPEYADILVARRRSLQLRGLTRLVPEGSSVTVTSDNPNVTVVTPLVTLEQREDFDWIGEARVGIRGTQVGSEAILTAECEGLIAEAMVQVVARSEPTDREITPRRRRGLFNEVRFSEERNPRQRVRYDRESKDVIIAVNHASVRSYIRDVTGAGTDTPQGQVMLAELISEAVCETIARHGIETGRFAAPVGGEVEAIRVQQLRLQNQYSGLIHEVIVAAEFRA